MAGAAGGQDIGQMAAGRGRHGGPPGGASGVRHRRQHVLGLGQRQQRRPVEIERRRRHRLAATERVEADTEPDERRRDDRDGRAHATARGQPLERARPIEAGTAAEPASSAPARACSHAAEEGPYRSPSSTSAWPGQRVQKAEACSSSTCAGRAPGWPAPAHVVRVVPDLGERRLADVAADHRQGHARRDVAIGAHVAGVVTGPAQRLVQIRADLR